MGSAIIVLWKPALNAKDEVARQVSAWSACDRPAPAPSSSVRPECPAMTGNQPKRRRFVPNAAVDPDKSGVRRPAHPDGRSRSNPALPTHRPGCAALASAIPGSRVTDTMEDRRPLSYRVAGATLLIPRRPPWLNAPRVSGRPDQGRARAGHGPCVRRSLRCSPKRAPSAAPSRPPTRASTRSCGRSRADGSPHTARSPHSRVFPTRRASRATRSTRCRRARRFRGIA